MARSAFGVRWLYIGEPSPLERSHGQQGSTALGVGEFGKPIAFRRFAQAFFTG
jgi:hypothetical protein